MANPSPPDDDWLHAWACRLLAQPAGATWSVARAEFLRRVQAAEYCPAPPVDYAQRVLSGDGAAVPADFGWQFAQLDREAELGREVEQLAQQWFALGIPQRQESWRRLYSACGHFPNLCVRLEALRTAWDVDLSDLTGPQQQLARMMADLFVLRPSARALLRRELLLELEENNAFWETSAGELRENHPRIAALEPALLSAIVGHKLHAKQARAAKKAFAKSAKAANTTSSPNRWPILIVVFVVLNLVRMALQNSSSPTPPPPRPFVHPRPFPNQQDKGPNDLQKLLEGKWKVQGGKLVPVEPGPERFPGQFEMRDGKVVIVPKPGEPSTAKPMPPPNSNQQK
jgi:hypothetical protein